MPISETYLIDCMKYMASLPDGYFDLAVVDPPYGKNIDNEKSGNFVMTKHKSKKWDISPPNKKYFKELFRVSKKQIIWGGNYFPLIPSSCWIIWDKVNPLSGKFSDFEMAWTSFFGASRIYRQEWIGFGRNFIEKEKGIHPTQKPQRLYHWIFTNYTKPGQKILDTHLGSQSSRIAAWDLGLDFYGCEIDKEYFDDGNKRFEAHKNKPVLFDPKEMYNFKQTELF